VKIRCEGRIVAEHPRSWVRGITITDPKHVQIAKTLRASFQQPRPVNSDGLLRDLGDYDRAIGLEGGVG
jgi:hypothetical protein